MSNKIVDSLLAGGRVTNAKISLWRDVAELLAVLDQIGQEGATAVVKIDGKRPDGSLYSIVISGGRLGEDFFRKDGGDLPVLLQDAIEFYMTPVRR